MNPEEIARYVATHPEFFEQYPHLLTDLRLSHPYEGRAIPIAERQILQLRDKIVLLETKLSEFVQFAEENDQISQKMHALTLDMLAAQMFEDLVSQIYHHMNENFALPYVALRVWCMDLPITECAPCDASLKQWVHDMSQPLCGANVHAEVLSWLGNNDEPCTFAVIPLRVTGQANALGVLVLASTDTQRFFLDMGTLYLQRLGELVAAACQCFMSSCSLPQHDSISAD